MNSEYLSIRTRTVYRYAMAWTAEVRAKAHAARRAKSKLDANAYDWGTIQLRHDSGILWTRLPTECGISKTVLRKAKEAGLLVKRSYHQWRAHHKRSVPCEAFKETLRTRGITFVEEFKPLSDRQFSIDVSFPDRKLGIEINGNQHYEKAGVLREYYQRRHDLIVAAGWTLLEIHFSIVYDGVRLKQLVDSIATGQSPNIDYSFYIKQPRRPKYGDRAAYAAGLRAQNTILQAPRVQMLMESSIDFTRFGWVTQAANLLQIRPQKVKQWMLRFAPSFYEECFHYSDRGRSRTCN